MQPNPHEVFFDIVDILLLFAIEIVDSDLPTLLLQPHDIVHFVMRAYFGIDHHVLSATDLADEIS
jgi:hypothetical protein